MADATRALTFPSTVDYDGLCLELVNELLHQHPSGRILYVVAAVFGAAIWEINPGSDDAEGPFTVPARSGVACAEGR